MPQISKLTKEAQNTADNINHFPYIGVWHKYNVFSKMQLHALKYDTEFNYMILLQSRHTQHSCTVYYLHSNIKWHKSHRQRPSSYW